MLNSTVERRLTALIVLLPTLVLFPSMQRAEAQDNETSETPAADALAEAAAGRIAEDLVTHWAWDPDVSVSVDDGGFDLNNVLIFHVWQGRQIFYAVAANRTSGEIITPYDDDSFARILEAEGLLSSGASHPDADVVARLFLAFAVVREERVIIDGISPPPPPGRRAGADVPGRGGQTNSGAEVPRPRISKGDPDWRLEFFTAPMRHAASFSNQLKRYVVSIAPGDFTPDIDVEEEVDGF